MTKKDYVLIASVFGKEIATQYRWYKKERDEGKMKMSKVSIQSAVQTEMVAIAMAVEFKRIDPKFNKAKFMESIDEARKEEDRFWKEVVGE